jgi:Uma2 family endonuclease
MATARVTRHDAEDYPVILTLPEPVDEAALLFLSRENPAYRFETMVDGRLVVSPLTGTFASMREAELVSQVVVWNKRARLGHVLSSNGGITLADGAMKGPDAAFISQRRLAELSPEREERAFEQIAPEAVFELLSPSDRLRYTIEKCEAYVRNGSAVAVLINPRERSVTLYRPDREPVVIRDATAVDIGDELPGFTLDATAIFAAGEP